VLRGAEELLGEPARSFIRSPAALSHLRRNRLRAELAGKTNRFDRLKHIAAQIRRDPGAVAAFMPRKFKTQLGFRWGNQAFDWIRFLGEHGLKPNLIAIDETVGLIRSDEPITADV
jgi:hypothetical protein